MKIRMRIADPGTRETVAGLLALCGIADGNGDAEDVLTIADGTGPAAENGCTVFLTPRDMPDGTQDAARPGNPPFVLPVPILLEEGIRVLTEAARTFGGSPAEKPLRGPDAPSIGRDGDSPERTEEIAISPDGKRVSRRGNTVRLTPREAGLFRILYERRGETVSREELSGPAGSRSNLTDVYIGYLRKKLRPVFGDGVILSVRGKGYVLRLP